MKRVAAVTKRKFKKKKRNLFINFCKSLNRNETIKYVWNKFELFNHKKVKNRHNIEDSQKLEILNDLAVCNILPEPQIKKITEPIKQFSMDELENSLRDKTISGPGLDDVSYLLIKKLPLKAREALLNIYNKSLNNGTIPEE